MEWECRAERFIAEHPISCLCSFDRARAGEESLRRVRDVHAVRV